jgi:membrane protein
MRLRRAFGQVGALLERAVSEFFGDGCPQRAAAISYYALFSLFPCAILAVAAFGIVVNDAEARTRVIDFVLDNLPLSEDQGRARLSSLLTHITAQVGGFGAIGVLGLVFAASGVMGAIRHALNAAFDAPEHRPPAQGKLFDIVLVAGFGLVIAVSFSLTIAAGYAEDLSRELAKSGSLGAGVARAVLALGRLAPIVLTFAVALALFRIVPARRPKLRDVWPGALFVAVGFELAKTGFAVYLSTVANYSAVYASLGTIIAFLVFVYVAAIVLLLGAEVASEWPAVRDAGPQEDGQEGEPFTRRLWGTVRGLFVRHGGSGAHP